MEDCHFSRLLSNPARYNSSKQAQPDASFRLLYYGGASGSVPFLWESRPGTPKHPSASHNSPPPLTPPPYYQLSNPKPAKHSRSNSGILKSILSISKAVTPTSGKMSAAVSRPAMWPSSSSSSSSSTSSFSSSYSAPPTPTPSSKKNGAMMCFRRPREYGGNQLGAGRISMRRVKKAVLAIVGH